MTKSLYEAVTKIFSLKFFSVIVRNCPELGAWESYNLLFGCNCHQSLSEISRVGSIGVISFAFWGHVCQHKNSCFLSHFQTQEYFHTIIACMIVSPQKFSTTGRLLKIFFTASDTHMILCYKMIRALVWFLLL